MAELSGRERILAALRHEEPDWVPVSPRVGVKHGTPGLVEKTVREAMEIAKPGGGFIIGSSDSFREGTPRENIDAYFVACRRYGKY